MRNPTTALTTGRLALSPPLSPMQRLTQRQPQRQLQPRLHQSRPQPQHPQRPVSSPKRWLGALLVVGVLLCSQAAHAQIEPQKPARVNAANRRALKEAHRTDSPYKDSHLAVKPARLKRGQSTPPQAKDLNEGNNEVDFAPEKADQAKSAGFLGLRRKARPQPRAAGSIEKK